MARVSSLTFALLAVLFSQTNQALAEKSGSIRPFIVGGTEADKGEFPFIASLQSSSGSHFCGGSLVKPNWVLTAAHCVAGGGPRKVVLGLHDRTRPDGNAEVFRVAQIVKHPQNNSENMDFDFALIKLSGNSKFEPVSLNQEEIRDQSDLVTAGWGTTSEGGYGLPALLQKVTVPFVNDEICARAYPGQTTPSMICAGYEQGGKDSCQGDSGGPLVVGDGSARKLVGVVSWGEGCARPNKYGIYGKVSAAISWIDETTR